jgi:hypothetical protein
LAFSAIFPPLGHFQGVLAERGETHMAGIRKKGNAYYCTFRFQGARYNFTIGEVAEDKALAKGVEVDETLNLLNRGRLTVPENVDFVDFVASGGKIPAVATKQKPVTARQLFDA